MAIPLLLLGVPVDAARGHGPIPFGVGVPVSIVIGKGYGPIPFITGSVIQTITPPVGVYYGGGGGFFSPEYTKRETWVDEGLRAQIRADLIRQKILRDDQEVMDIIVIIVKSGILE